MRYIQSKWFYNQASKYRQGAHSEEMEQQQQRRQKNDLAAKHCCIYFTKTRQSVDCPFCYTIRIMQSFRLHNHFVLLDYG